MTRKTYRYTGAYLDQENVSDPNKFSNISTTNWYTEHYGHLNNTQNVPSIHKNKCFTKHHLEMNFVKFVYAQSQCNLKVSNHNH